VKKVLKFRGRRIDDLERMSDPRAVLFAGVCLTLCTGCGAFGHHGVPEDPLFVNRKPIEAHAVSGPPITIARASPVPPANPYFAEPAYATGRRLPAATASGRSRTVPGILTGRPAANEAKPED
jgi:hypothetical protein